MIPLISASQACKTTTSQRQEFLQTLKELNAVVVLVRLPADVKVKSSLQHRDLFLFAQLIFSSIVTFLNILEILFPRCPL